MTAHRSLRATGTGTPRVKQLRKIRSKPALTQHCLGRQNRIILRIPTRHYLNPRLVHRGGNQGIRHIRNHPTVCPNFPPFRFSPPIHVLSRFSHLLRIVLYESRAVKSLICAAKLPRPNCKKYAVWVDDTDLTFFSICCTLLLDKRHR